MDFQDILSILLLIILFDFALDRVLKYLNNQSSKKPIPTELKGIYSEEKYAKSQEYNQVKSRFGALSATFSFVLTFLMLYFGGFGLLDEWVRAHSPNQAINTLLFFGILYVVSDLLGTPFSWYSNFIIEERFGFNKMTQKTFWLDKVKAYLLTFILGGILLSLFVYLVHVMGRNFWIYFWVIITGVILLLNMFYTSIFLPMFNKLSKLEDGPLYQSIKNYSEKVNFPLKNIFVMDGSKRSSKGNAFFSGFGKRKKVVLFDTLIENHSVEELTAVFAHEVGHFKKKHIILNTLVSILTTGGMLYLLSLMIDNGEVGRAMAGPGPVIHLNILAFGILFSPLSRILGILGNILSRKNEFEADRYAVETYNGQPLITALKTMSADHLSNLTPHPAFVFLHYSHPPLLDRVRAMNEVMQMNPKSP